ncbi:MAG: hypothetical protein LBT20_06075 [Clostridiales bacterium]|jgi:hypothetical protein|nr:hypothetical protein [Clostridiales bacterium]
MNNFEHEITEPQDKKIGYYLYSDYFYDSVILDINCNHDSVMVSLLCDREQEEWYNTNKGTHDEKRAKLKELESIHTYQIIFKKYQYFNHEHGQYYGFANGEYLNGRFKRSALCQKIEGKTKRPHYHFRIETTCGYIDIICEKICIKKQSGRVKNITLQLNADENPFPMAGWLKKNKLTDKDGQPKIDKIIKLAEDEDDIGRYLALTYLAITRNEKSIYCARNCMKLEGELDSKIPSVWILGEFGDESDITILMKELLNNEIVYTRSRTCAGSTLIERRNIIDSIEKIQYRIMKSLVSK